MKYLVMILIAAGGIYYYFDHFMGPSANIITVNDANFQSVVLESKKPVLLFFYWNKNTSDYDHVRRAMSKLSELTGDKMLFGQYCMQDGGMDEKYDVKNDGIGIRFENGVEQRREGFSDLKETPSLSGGQLFFMARDLVGDKIASGSSGNRPLTITAADLEDKVFKSKKPVLINITQSASECGIVNASADAFASVAGKYGEYADFYFMDVMERTNDAFLQKNAISNIPSVVSFYKGKETFKSQKTYEDEFNFNEAQFIGMFLPYLETIK